MHLVPFYVIALSDIQHPGPLGLTVQVKKKPTPEHMCLYTLCQGYKNSQPQHHTGVTLAAVCHLGGDCRQNLQAPQHPHHYHAHLHGASRQVQLPSHRRPTLHLQRFQHAALPSCCWHVLPVRDQQAPCHLPRQQCPRRCPALTLDHAATDPHRPPARMARLQGQARRRRRAHGPCCHQLPPRCPRWYARELRAHTPPPASTRRTPGRRMQDEAAALSPTP